MVLQSPGMRKLKRSPLPYLPPSAAHENWAEHSINEELWTFEKRKGRRVCA